MKRRSIRFRLTAWYGAVLLAGLILFGFGSWFAMRRSLYESADHELRDRIRGVKAIHGRGNRQTVAGGDCRGV